MTIELNSYVNRLQQENNAKSTLPDAKSIKVSSDSMIVTSAFGCALPMYTVPVFFKSIVHIAVSLASLVTCSSKTPFV